MAPKQSEDGFHIWKLRIWQHCFPFALYCYELSINRESYNSNMDHQQSKNDETLDWNGPLDVLGPTFSGVMSRLYLL